MHAHEGETSGLHNHFVYMHQILHLVSKLWFRACSAQLGCNVRTKTTVLVQAGCGVKLDELVSVQLCLFLFNPVFHACVYLFYLIQFFMHAR